MVFYFIMFITKLRFYIEIVFIPLYFWVTLIGIQKKNWNGLKHENIIYNGYIFAISKALNEDSRFIKNEYLIWRKYLECI